MKPSPREEGTRWLLQAQQDISDAEYADRALELARYVIQFVENRFPPEGMPLDEAGGE